LQIKKYTAIPQRAVLNKKPDMKKVISTEKKDPTIAALLQDPAFLNYLGEYSNMPVDEAYRQYVKMNNQKYLDNQIP